MKLTKSYLRKLIAEVVSEQEAEKEKNDKDKKILNDDNINDTSTGRWQVKHKVKVKSKSQPKPQPKKIKENNTEECQECKECDDNIKEVSPPGWEKTVEAMKKHKDITNPFALAWYMKNKGYESHK